MCVCSLCGSQICLAEVGPGPVMLTAAGEPRLRRPKFGFWFVVCSFDHRFYTGVRSFMFCAGVGDPLAASQCNGLTMRSRGRVLAQKLRRGPKQEFPGLPLYTLSSPCVCVCLHIMGCVLACCRSHRLYPDSTRSSGLAVIVRAQ